MSKQSRKQKKDLAKQQEKQAQLKANAAATEAIKSFLELLSSSLERRPLDNAAWHLHVLCRTGDGVNYGFDYFEIELLKSFFEKLILFFLSSDNAKQFNKEYGDVHDLGDRLEKLRDYFNSLNNSRIWAELDLIDIEHFANQSVKECSDKVWYYQREEELLSAKNAILLDSRKQLAA